MSEDEVKFVKVIRHDLSRLFQDLGQLAHPSYHLNDQAAWQPYADVYETEDEFVIKLELAGVAKSDISITLIDDRLCIRGLRRELAQEDGRRWYHKMEIIQGQFEKMVAVPQGIATNQIKSSFNNGILDIRLPKSQKLTVEVPVE
ncbi:Hsp20/alpha crystallin family protein [candidate division TA06 bacterium]|uniref:Hsp20/alpha crystallin family protein n=1 Tax=candidate division TA06 bacterium TaxID=2250710 RepID=A0A933MJQ1_UNCT6|nr:Hsp20/alpha crystallin family protein [candidate division TA06 bacterium]